MAIAGGVLAGRVIEVTPLDTPVTLAKTAVPANETLKTGGVVIVLPGTGAMDRNTGVACPGLIFTPVARNPFPLSVGWHSPSGTTQSVIVILFCEPSNAPPVDPVLPAMSAPFCGTNVYVVGFCEPLPRGLAVNPFRPAASFT